MARELLNEDIAEHPAVVRLALGDVITVDLSGRAVPRYEQLAEAQVVLLRVCHFPGQGRQGNEICLAELTETAKQYVYRGERPLKIVSSIDGQFRPENRTFVDLEVAVPILKDLTAVTKLKNGERLVTYTAQLQMTPISEALNISPDILPKQVTGTARILRDGNGWRIEANTIPEPQANAG